MDSGIGLASFALVGKGQTRRGIGMPSQEEDRVSRQMLTERRESEEGRGKKETCFGHARCGN